MIDSLRVGTHWRVGLRFKSGYRAVDLTGRAVTADVKMLATGTPVTTTLNVVDAGTGYVELTGADNSLTEAGDLSIELTVDGSPYVNANAHQLLVPVRLPHTDPS